MDRRRIIFLLFVMGLVVSMVSGAGRPIRFSDMFGMWRISDVHLSPDGKWVAYTVKTFDIESNTSDSNIWITNIANGKSIQMTTFKGADYSPRWMPDSKWLSFISTRSGKPQVWKISLKGGEAQQVTSLYTGIDDFTWFPDGKHLLYTATVWPDCQTQEANKKEDEKRAKCKSTGKIITKLFFRSWNRWVNDKYSHLFYYDVEHGTSHELVHGRINTPPLDLGSSHDFVISPDGVHVCYVANPDPEPAISTNNDIFMINMKTGKVKNITVENHACDAAPRFSPDGNKLAWLSMKRAGFEADKKDIIVMDLASGKCLNLTKDWDRSVVDFSWSPNGKMIYFTAYDAGKCSIFSVDLSGGLVKKVVGPHWNAYPQVTSDGGKLVFARQAVNHPYDIYYRDLKTDKIVQLTHINDTRLAPLDMNTLKEFYFTGAYGDRVHGLYLLPPGFDSTKKYPVVFLIHGGPQGMFGDDFHYRWNAEMFASPGWVVVMINFHGSEGYGQKFTDAVSKNWGGAPYEDIMKGVKYFLSHYSFVEPEKIAAAGASYGGFMIDWIEGHTDIFRCLVSHDGVFDQRSMYGATEELWFPEWEFNGTPWDKGSLYEKWSPSNYVQNFKTPMLVIHSQRDYRVPVTQGFQLFTALQRKGVESKLLYFPDEDHFVQKPQNARLWWKTVLGWISDHLK